MEMKFGRSAEDMRCGEKFLTTGCEKIDEGLRSGIARRGITQIYGEAGTGKTQYALQLCLAVQIPERCGGCGAGECGKFCFVFVFRKGRRGFLFWSGRSIFWSFFSLMIKYDSIECLSNNFKHKFFYEIKFNITVT